MIFDYWTWFSISLLLNQREKMRDVLPSGVKMSLAKDEVCSLFISSSSSGNIIIYHQQQPLILAGRFRHIILDCVTSCGKGRRMMEDTMIMKQ